MTSANRSQDLYHAVMRAAALGLAVNLSLGAMKLIGGIVSGSFALIADAVNSLGDAVSTIIILLALRVSQLPADREHPYGHTRAEGIAATNVALLIIVSALFVGWQAIQRFNLPHGIPPAWTLWMAGANVVIKEMLFHYKIRIGKRTGSTALIANAWDHRSDALCALAVLVGLGAVRFGGPRLIWADEAASLVVVAAIVWAGVKLFQTSASDLMDVQADDRLVLDIRRVAESVDGVVRVETLRVRKSGIEYFVEIHIEVDPMLTIAKGHSIGHRVKDRLLEKFPNLRDVLVHLEPADPIKSPAD